MFWADEVAEQLKQRKLPREWVDDMKTPSGRVHVGSLFGVVFHDLVYRALQDKGVTSTYTYLFENHDPMDDIPSYLPRAEYEKYLGMPLFKVPSPVEGYKDFAEYYALEFQQTFNAIGTYPEIIWTKDLYTSGKMNKGIKTILDNAGTIRAIYMEMYKKEIAENWYPFQVYCDQCGKVSTTRVFNWDGEFVHYTCPVDAIKWTNGCGYKGKTSPFSDENGMKGKMPWKVEWPVKWQAIGVTVEGAGKDHMSRGGSHDLATLVCERVLHYPVPYPVSYEFMLIGGKKMSSSKGMGFSAADILTILPPELARFLIVKMDIKQQTNFDPSDKDTIPRLFDEYQRAADAYFNKTDDTLSRIFELSQIKGIKKPPSIRFSMLTQWVQMPNMQKAIETQGLTEWATYAKVWLEKYAPESEKFFVLEQTPDAIKHLSAAQKKLLQQIAVSLDTAPDAETFQTMIYDIGKSLGLNGKATFAAIYTALLGKDHGPKAAWLITSLDKSFVKNRFENIEISENTKVSETSNVKNKSFFNKPEIFSIQPEIFKKYPDISVGVAIIKGVHIEQKNNNLENEKEQLLESLTGLTTEQLGQYPEIIAYRKLYKQMGIDWHSRRPSPEALLRRVALNKGLYTINTCVDAYNLVVMQHRVSVGAFDYDAIKFPTQLRFPQEHEEILLLGDAEATKYKTTELAYFDQKGGFNLDFNYRDAQRTAVTQKTKNIYVNVDGIDTITPQIVEKVLTEACQKIITFCGGELKEFGIASSNLQ